MDRIKKRFRFLCLVAVLGYMALIGAPTTTYAEEGMRINYSGYVADKGWSAVADDNRLCLAGEDGYFTGMKANLLGQPLQMSGTVSYQVYITGEGWQDWTENGGMAGKQGGQQPLEAMRMELTGELYLHYDIYYAVFQKGVWSSWSVNGAVSGSQGQGLRLDGIKVSITEKGAGVPTASQDSPRVIDPGKPMIALTFDDGPNASVTNRILDVLEQYDARATFFMVGNRIAGNANTASVQRMSDLGCETANHTYEHKTLTKLSMENAKNQLDKANQTISQAGGKRPLLMRPPGGARDSASLSTVDSLGMYAIMWSVDTLDWKTRNKQKTIDAVLNQVKDGDIVLMHDLYSSTADAVEVIVPQLIAKGYQLVTVSELAQSRGGLAPGKVYYRFPLQ